MLFFIISSPRLPFQQTSGSKAGRLPDCVKLNRSCVAWKKKKELLVNRKLQRFRPHIRLPPLSFSLFFPFFSLLSVHSANRGYVKANFWSLSIKDFMCPIKKTNTGCPLESEVSFPCLIMSVWKIAMLISWRILPQFQVTSTHLGIICVHVPS